MNENILIADDDYDNRTIAATALLAAGFRVVEAEDGQKALELALKEKPDLVLLDLSMPGLDGWEVARRIRSGSPSPGPRLVAFTAHAMQGAEEAAKRAGCDGFLTKPCRPMDIVRCVQGWIEAK